MKKVFIIGAGGSLARCVIEALKPLNDVKLTLFVRNSRKSIAAFITTIIQNPGLYVHENLGISKPIQLINTVTNN